MGRGLGSIEQLRALWHGETGSAGRRAAWAFFGAALVAATLVGRLGHDWSRALALGIIIVGIVPALVRLAILRRQRQDPRAVMSATILRTEPELARAALRALTLTHKISQEPERGSSALAELHFARLLGRAALDPLAARAGRVAWRASIAGAVLACAAFVAVVVDPFRMVEGVDVLVARDRVAPIELSWVELPRLSAEPPSYLNMPRRPLRPYFPAALPVGTVITVHAVPLREGRRLVLTDGVDEVDFHDDGEGAVVARWRVERDASLSISARFGEVRIEEPERLEIQAIVDHAPHVRLAGAPVTYRLLEKPRIVVHWEAIDDHGVREVALVLRAGEREERRELSRPQGVAVDRGGIELLSGDPFLDKSYLPVEVTVEALDNDPVSGPKWGRSAPIVVIPPQIGEREALRYAALARARHAVVDLLAGRIDRGTDDLAGYAERESQAQKSAVATLEAAATESFGGLQLTGRLAALVRGQTELLDKALQQARAAPSKAGHDKLVAQTETTVLAVDSALGALGVRDSREAALKLSDVALDVAAAIELSREPAERTRATRRFDADLVVLEEGGVNLLRLGELGVDLGEIVENGLRRIRRGWSAGDRHHARLAALDLAARLRMPDPSFRSSGGGHGHGGTEAGGMPQPGEGDPSSAASDAAAVEQALEQLRQEHAAEMAAVERALDSALDPEDKSALEEQLREAARKVREAVADLPQQASDPSSARAAAAQGRSQAEAMAGALERGELSDAAEQGKRAVESLRAAEERGGSAPDPSSERQTGEEAGSARAKLEQLMEEARRTAERSRREASEGARGDLQRSAKRERELAERAREIRRRSSESEAPLPQEMLERLREAAEMMERAGTELGGGDGPKGQETQRQAQRLLEMSQPESQQSDRDQEEQGDGRDFARDADVPPEARDESADAFRKRVTDGLSRKAPPHLRDALRRYTEGLLR